MACSSGQPQDGTLVVQDGHMGPIKLPEGVVFSTPLSDHMAECSRRRSVVQSVADEAEPRATSMPPTSEPRARPPPKKRCSLGSLRKFGARIQDLPRPVPMEEDLRGNYMSASSTGHIHKKENLERAWWGGSTSAVTETEACQIPESVPQSHESTAFEDSDTYVEEALHAVKKLEEREEIGRQRYGVSDARSVMAQDGSADRC